jgi:hypothetical protein
MKNRILFALFPVALLSMAAKGGGCGSEEPIVGVSEDASSPDTGTGIGDCPIPPPTCAAGYVFTVADCKCVPTQATDADAPTDTGTSVPLPGDCLTPIPATSPFYVYLSGTPAGSTEGQFAVSATGSAGDKVSLAFFATQSDGTIDFQGTGESAETYQITVDYNGATVFQESAVGWSVAGCGFSENIDLATDAHTP